MHDPHHTFGEREEPGEKIELLVGGTPFPPGNTVVNKLAQTL